MFVKLPHHGASNLFHKKTGRTTCKNRIFPLCRRRNGRYPQRSGGVPAPAAAPAPESDAFRRVHRLRAEADRADSGGNPPGHRISRRQFKGALKELTALSERPGTREDPRARGESCGKQHGSQGALGGSARPRRISRGGKSACLSRTNAPASRPSGTGAGRDAGRSVFPIPHPPAGLTAAHPIFRRKTGPAKTPRRNFCAGGLQHFRLVNYSA